MVVHPQWPSRALKAGVFLYLLYLFLLSFITNSELGRMFFGTLPTFIGIVLFVLAMLTPFASFLVILVPVILGVIFYAIWQSGIIAVLTAVDGLTLTVLNIVATFVMYIILYLFIPHKPEHFHEMAPKPHVLQPSQERVIVNEVQTQDPQQQEHINALTSENEKYRIILAQYQHQSAYSMQEQKRLHELATGYQKVIQEYAHTLQKQQSELSDAKSIAHDATKKSKESLHIAKRLSDELAQAKASLAVTQDTFITNIRSIEDKCKAINFVVGRVYADKNGGSESIRKKLRIDRDLYNLFSLITQNFSPEDASQLYTVLEAVKLRLSQYHFTEAKVFDARIYSRGLSSKEDKTILEWLSIKDQDPVTEYHAEASSICVKMQEFLQEKKYV